MMHFYREFACHYDSCQLCGRPRVSGLGHHLHGHCGGDCLNVALMLSGQYPHLFGRPTHQPNLNATNESTDRASGPPLPDSKGPQTSFKE